MTSGRGWSTRSVPSIPSVEVDYNHVDAACIYLVESPQRYGVIVTDNLFGDILSDLGGRGHRWHRLRGERESESRAHRRVALRAGPRRRARHRRHRHEPIRWRRSPRPC